MRVIQLIPFLDDKIDDKQEFFSGGEKKEKEREIEESHSSIPSKTTGRLRDIISQQRDLAIKRI